MDRFIVLILKQRTFIMKILKSNMDRFIAFFSALEQLNKICFKIQYG